MTTAVPPTLGPIGRARASLAAIETVLRLQDDTAAAPSAEDLEALRGWSGWGPMAPALEITPKEGTWSQLAERLRELLPPRLIRQAEQATPTAYYTPPQIADACWRTLTDLGLGGGQVREPGCGAGTFMAHTPAGVPVDWLGVERDPITSGIASYLHPDAEIINEPMQRARLPRVEAVLGNVPYADTQIHDPTAPEAVTSNLHNYMIWRSVKSLKPGGVAVLLTSRYTMDSGSDEARRAIARDAELLGAVRVPSGALREGGTEALADILVLCRRDGTAATGNEEWLETVPAPGVPGQVINRHFARHPEHVLGTLAPDFAPQYGRVMRVNAPEGQDLPAVLGEALSGIAQQALADGRAWNVAADAAVYTEDALPFPVREDGRKEGSFHLVEGRPHEVLDGELVPVSRPGKELPKLIALRDATLALLEAEADYDRPDAELEPLRGRLNQLYDAYVKAHGYLNRYTMQCSPRERGWSADATCAVCC